MSSRDKPIVWIQGEVKTPPFSAEARLKAGFLLRRFQQGDLLEMPDSRPMPSIVMNCESMIKIKHGVLSILLMMMPYNTGCFCKENSEDTQRSD